MSSGIFKDKTLFPDVLAGGGGKKSFTKRLAFSWLSFTSIFLSRSSLVQRVGIWGLPPLPTGSFRYLFAVQMSLADMSSRSA